MSALTTLPSVTKIIAVQMSTKHLPCNIIHTIYCTGLTRKFAIFIFTLCSYFIDNIHVELYRYSVCQCRKQKWTLCCDLYLTGCNMFLFLAHCIICLYSKFHCLAKYYVRQQMPSKDTLASVFQQIIDVTALLLF